MRNTIIFDMDGVILDSEPLWFKGQRDAFATVGVDITSDMHQSTMGIRASQIVKHWYARYPWDICSCTQVNDIMIKAVINYIIAEGVLADGLLNFLQDCHKNNMTMAICSSSDMRIIKAVVEKFQLQKYITYLHSGEDEKYGKPHPAGYVNTMQYLGVKPHNCIVFEDSVNGAIAGKASGAKLVVIPNVESDHEDFTFADFIYDDFTQVKLSHLITS